MQERACNAVFYTKPLQKNVYSGKAVGGTQPY